MCFARVSLCMGNIWGDVLVVSFVNGLTIRVDLRVQSPNMRRDAHAVLGNNVTFPLRNDACIPFFLCAFKDRYRGVNDWGDVRIDRRVVD